MQILSRFEKEMPGMTRLSRSAAAADAIEQTGSVTVFRKLKGLDGSKRQVQVLVVKERLSAKTAETADSEADESATLLIAPSYGRRV